MDDKKDYLHIGHAFHLTGKDRRLFRFFEILPGALSWGTLLSVILFSWVSPTSVAIFIIVFDVYWLVKTAYLSLHLRSSWNKMQHHLVVDWEERIKNLHTEDVWQLVFYPVSVEPIEMLDATFESLMKTTWSKKRMIVVLPVEERMGDLARTQAEFITKKYGDKFGHFLVTTHPEGIEGELKGKGSNTSWAARKVKELVIDKEGIPYENIIVSNFDSDTQLYPNYFECLTYHFLTAEKPHRSAYQPIPIYNNNIWQAPAIARVAAMSATYWQMMQQVRPERLTTFSSHSMSFVALVELGFWQTNMVSEDSRIFWNGLLKFDGDYRVVPLFYPVAMDANLAPTFLQTAKNIYKQQRRWTWGVENLSYLLYGFTKNKTIPFRTKAYHVATQVEGFWSLATNPILIFLLGWVPLALGGIGFNSTILAYQLPRVTRTIMTIAMLGLIGSAIMGMKLMPPRPEKYHKLNWVSVILQWVLIPFMIMFFGAIPGLDAQTRLMFGKYMGFWVTPKDITGK